MVKCAQPKTRKVLEFVNLDHRTGAEVNEVTWQGRGSLGGLNGRVSAQGPKDHIQQPKRCCSLIWQSEVSPLV